MLSKARHTLACNWHMPALKHLVLHGSLMWLGPISYKGVIAGSVSSGTYIASNDALHEIGSGNARLSECFKKITSLKKFHTCKSIHKTCKTA